MKIGIVGLGLLGGSIAKALKRVGHQIVGVDSNPAVLKQALKDGAIDVADGVESCAVVFVCLYPRDAVAYMLGTAFQKGALVTDICGVKRFVAENVAQKLHEAGVRYVGGHPMAGREVGGFENSDGRLFAGASYIITRDVYTSEVAAEQLAALAMEMGCGRVTYSTPEEHDRAIAYTSQLAHVVSNCYVKNPIAQKTGFSAGSFLDLTRVAKMNAAMWAELFIENGDFLAGDIDNIVQELQRLKTAVLSKDEALLCRLLDEGSKLKEKISEKF